MITKIINIKNVCLSDARANEDAVISLWESAGEFFTNYKITTGEDTSSITIDVSSICETLTNSKPENCHDYFSKLYKNNECLTGEEFYKLNPLGAKLIIHTDNESFNVTRFLQQLFLAMNIAHCGSCNLLSYTIEKHGPLAYLNSSENLSATVFDDFFAVHINNQWPEISYLPFSKTWDWLESQNIRTTSLAKTPAQKACAVLINLSLTDLHYAELLLGVTQALEAMLLKNGEPKAYNLNIKINALLGSNPKEINWVKKMYNLRSSIIHGEHHIYWPSEHPEIDTDPNSEEELHVNEINDYFVLGVSALIALLQNLIKQNKTKYKFTNKLHVESI